MFVFLLYDIRFGSLCRRAVVDLGRIIALTTGRAALEEVVLPAGLQIPLSHRTQRMLRSAQVSPW